MTYALKRRALRAMGAVAIILGRVAAATAAAQAEHRPVSIDDVLNMTHLDHVALSPDGQWVATVVQRPAGRGEVYGRTAYETDPSRNDVWLISRHTGERRNITMGAASAAGFWCATWSPDGQRLAMLSTQPQGKEPRGGDNVRLYVWERTTGRLERLADTAVMTQTRYGAGMDRLDLRGGGDASGIAHNCSVDGENAPFAWLDRHRLLVVMLPLGRVSGLIDEYARPPRAAALDADALHDGLMPTGVAVGSGAERMPLDRAANGAMLDIIDTALRTVEPIADVPAYPFRGELSVVIAPDRRRIAVLATVGAIQPQAGRRLPYLNDDSWTVEKELGFADLVYPAGIDWVPLPPDARFPLELYGWSPDGHSIAMRARSDPFDMRTRLFVVAATGSVLKVSQQTIGGSSRRRRIRMRWKCCGRTIATFSPDLERKHRQVARTGP